MVIDMKAEWCVYGAEYMLYNMALEFRMNNKLWKPSFYTETCSVSVCLYFNYGLLLDREMLGTQVLGKKETYPIPASNFCMFYDSQGLQGW